MSAQEDLSWVDLKLCRREKLRNRLGELVRAEAIVREEIAELHQRLGELAERGAFIREETTSVLTEMITVTDELRYCDVNTLSLEGTGILTGAALATLSNRSPSIQAPKLYIVRS